jgi:tRNA A-37 threonylcarbamoyl transferase component Bud32
MVAGRFRVLGTLGAGGMATVYEVLDVSNDKRIALKRLHTQLDARKRRRTIELFEREFYTLSHLAHPRVVEAYDYGVDELGPYYTMELLDGGELQQLAPLPWRRACEVARDVASALSLLHSRRLVYRDLNPRNIRCTSNGLAKLIDFGAMGSMGPSKQVVGTPAYCAPEALDFQPLDARTDLYSLGATLYFVLTGRHAYPAKNFEQLRSFWQSRPLSPAELVPEIPAGLDALVMDLLHLDASVRPANAAEVMEQLAVIEGRTLEELPQVTQAYLSAPNLVGRDAVLTRIRAKLMRTLRGRGGSILIEGPSGVGRSRLLSACLLEGKLLGALALRADATDAEVDYGVMQSLCAQLLESAAELTQQAAAPHLDLLVHALPLLSEQPAESPTAVPSATGLRSQVLTALKDWLLSIAEQRPLLLAIDDLHAIDEPSAAALSLLTHAAGKHALVVVGTAQSGAVPTAQSALKLFADGATTLRLSNLEPPNTEELLRSVFGDVPHVQMVAHKLHAITEGNPRDVMQLAQYLVDRNLASYRSGAWSLPATIDSGDLPSNMAQALRVRVQALSAQACELALYMTLSADRSVSFDECVTLFGDDNPGAVVDALAELEGAQIVVRVADSYAIPQSGFIVALHAGLDKETRQRMHAGLAELFRQRGNEEFRRAQHLLRAGRQQAAIDVLVAFATESRRLTETNPNAFLSLVRSLPEDWLDAYLAIIDLSEACGRPRRETYVLRLRFSGVVNALQVPSAKAAPAMRELLRQLAELTGLSDLASIDPALPAEQRLRSALGSAKQRHEQTDELDRVVEPLGALRELVRTTVAAVGMASRALDHALWTMIPDLTPLVPLSAAIDVTERLRQGMGARLSGRFEAACATYREVVALTDREDHAGLDAANHRYTRYGVMCALGLMEAPLCLASSLTWAAQLDNEPLHQINWYQIRMLYHLWLGQVHEADKVKEQLDLVRMQAGPRSLSDGPYLVGRITANAAADDLTRIKHSLEDVTEFASRHDAWVPVRIYGTGEYHRIRGDHKAALQQLEAALDATHAGRHQIWVHAAAARVRVLVELGELEAARACGASDLAKAEAAQLGYACNYIKMPLALALAALDDLQAATEHADAALRTFEQLGSRGIHLVLAYETRARVALAARDMTEYVRCTELCAAQCAAANSRVLNAKYEKLKRAASSVEVRVSLPALDAADEFSVLTGSQLTSVLVGCNQPNDRAQRALDLLMRRCGAQAGYLYLLGPHGPNLVAQVGTRDVARGLLAFVEEYLDLQLQDDDLQTGSQDADADEVQGVWIDDEGRVHHPILLSHQSETGSVVTGLAIAVMRSTQRFVPAGTLAAHLSRLIQDAGDAKAVALR